MSRMVGPSTACTSYRETADWRDDASCLGDDTNLWFAFDPEEIEYAKNVCLACPVRESCLAFSLRCGASDGVFGGLDRAERRALARKLGIAPGRDECGEGYSGLSRGVLRHARLGQPNCPACAAFVKRQADAEAQGERIDQLLDSGLTVYAVAERLMISHTTVRNRAQRRAA